MVAIKKKGFTIIELLVSVTVFALVASAASEIFVFSIRNQKKFLSSQEIMDQASYIMEYASKSLRMARKDVDGSCIEAKLNYQKTATGQGGIRFENYQGVCQEFYSEGGQLKENKNGTIYPLTSVKLQVSGFSVSLSGESQTDNLQPKATLSLEIQSKEQAKIKIQTTVSQRNPDIEQ
ncbi:MAG: type II secretion system protein [bacterium]|nr:type II secretion system protein [bacterium]